MSPNEIQAMRLEEQRGLTLAFQKILRQYRQTGDEGQALEDLFNIWEES